MIKFLKLSFILAVLASAWVAVLWAEDTDAKKSTTQQVGGLLFDVDEGVKVEQGPGGSVYMKSNKEYMQQKFNEIDKQFKDLEQRITVLESQVAAASAKPGDVKAFENKAADTKLQQENGDSKNRVLMS